MKKYKIVFFGTPEIAAGVLEALLNDDRYEVIGVVSQPDKPVGRKKILTPSPVKVVALNHNIPVYQPISLRKDYEFLSKLDFDLLITTAYGQILPQAVLDMAKINNINVHGSLLPSYRGGAPIQRAIINGDKFSGITIMQMVDKMDAGLMYAKEKIDIDDRMNSSTLFKKMEEVGKNLLIRTLPSIIDGTNKGEQQDEEKVTFAWNIKREEEKIDFNNKVMDIHNLVRGLDEIPGAYCMFKEHTFKIYKSYPFSNENDDNPVGTLKIEGKNRLVVKCGDGYLELCEVQVEGKSKMDVKSFLNGIKKDELIMEKLY